MVEKNESSRKRGNRHAITGGAAPEPRLIKVKSVTPKPKPLPPPQEKKK
jgi:hypothetical protein